MTAKVQSMPRMNGISKPSQNSTTQDKKPFISSTTSVRKSPKPPSKAPAHGRKPPQPKAAKAASVADENPATGGKSAYAIMASRIANRVAEMAENISFVENKPQPREVSTEEDEKRRPRKLEMRLNSSSSHSVAFSAPFLDNTLQKMLSLQNRMLMATAELSRAEGVDEKIIREQANQSAELSRIIALICAEKARQGA